MVHNRTRFADVSCDDTLFVILLHIFLLYHLAGTPHNAVLACLVSLIGLLPDVSCQLSGSTSVVGDSAGVSNMLSHSGF